MDEKERIAFNKRHHLINELWGPYLSERAWGTVREDYSEDGNAWDYFPHDHARSRAYRWGEDGLAGISDSNQYLCFALGLWNGKDPILKERLFGLTGHEGNHGEDVKELYYYLDNTPTHAYMKYLYKYPHGEYPYNQLVAENRRRTKTDPEFELLDTEILNGNRYFDVYVEYAKNSPNDILVKITVYNRGPEEASLTLVPTLWFRNQWSFGLTKSKPSIALAEPLPGGTQAVDCAHKSLGDYRFYFPDPNHLCFTENETNVKRLYGLENASPYVKDLFHEAIVHGDYGLMDGKTDGTKFSPVYQITMGSQTSFVLPLRLSIDRTLEKPFSEGFDAVFKKRAREADDFYDRIFQQNTHDDLKNIQRQAMAGLLFTKQFYYYWIDVWLSGDKNLPPPPEIRKTGRNHTWKTLNNHDIISMPDKWEYPWYATWDLAYHAVAFSMIDPAFAKEQLITLTREWYMHPDGQLPAYEWNFNDTNPPLFAWAGLQIYQVEKAMGGDGDVNFLKRLFQKLLINFTWWVNKKDIYGQNAFEGGFLGLDNIGVFDRSSPIPGGGKLIQADGTAWMAMYALNLLDMALEIASKDAVFEDVATKFYEHFIYIAEAFNNSKLWDMEDGFFYDLIVFPDHTSASVKIRSLEGVISLFAISVMDRATVERLGSFKDRMDWFGRYRKNAHKYMASDEITNDGKILLSLLDKERLVRLLTVVLDENEMLSPYGVRSLSKYYKNHPYSLKIADMDYPLDYEPREASSNLFGGNSNWRGPIWLPLNYSLILSLLRYHEFYGESLTVECPTGSGVYMNLKQVAAELAGRIIAIFKKGSDGKRVFHGKDADWYNREGLEDLILFYEYFGGDDGAGLGASHQTGWTALVASLIQTFGG